MNQIVYGIFIKNDEILTFKEMGKMVSFFEMAVPQQENRRETLEQELNRLLGTDLKVTLFKDKYVADRLAFFVDITGLPVAESIQPLLGGQWAPLQDRKAFTGPEIHLFRALGEAAVRQGWQYPWLEPLKLTFFNGPGDQQSLERLARKRKELELDLQNPPGHRLALLAASLGVGFLFYLFFWDYLPGLSVPLWIGASLGIACYFHRHQLHYRNRLGLLLFSAVVLLSATFVIFNDPLLQFFNLLALPFLMTACFACMRYDLSFQVDWQFMIQTIHRVLIKAPITAPKFFSFARVSLKPNKEKKVSPVKRAVIAGLLISVPLMLVILNLLRSADMMFAYHLDELIRLFKPDLKNLSLDVIFTIALVSLYFFGMVWSFQYNRTVLPPAPKARGSFEPITVLTVMAVINFTYLLFTLVQFSYFYGGGITVLPEGFTYAEYARRGFFELVFVTLINFAILSICAVKTKETAGKLRHFLRGAYSLMIFFSFNMLVSASYKMSLYENAFGFTRLRVYVRAFMVLIALWLVLVLAGIWLKKFSVLHYSLIVTLVFYVGLNFINVDRIIARENINRYLVTGDMDMYYLTRLSYDAAPEINRLYELEDELLQPQKYEYFQRYHAEADPWFAYNVGRSRYRLLKQAYDAAVR